MNSSTTKDTSSRNNSNLSVVILAAGKGKRMESDLPKVLHPLRGKPMLSYVVETARTLKPSKIIIVVGNQAEKVKKTINASDCLYVLQKEQLGTAHAAMQTEQALADFKGDILLLSGDVPLIRFETILDMLKLHHQAGAIISLISTIVKNPKGYGRIIRFPEIPDANGNVIAIREEKDASEKEKNIREINSGIYCFNKDFLFNNLKKINCTNKQEEYYLTDLVEIAVENKFPISSFQANNPDEVLGINTVAELQHMEKTLI